MRPDDLLGARAWGQSCGTARIKITPDDFVVEEVCSITPSGSGEHLWLWVEKIGLNTEDAARIISKQCSVPLRQVSFAGLKDKQAHTKQWFSVHLPGKNLQLPENLSDGLRILSRDRHSRKLQRGAHSGNRFVITLQELQAEHDCLLAKLKKISSSGVPNYYGWQRFGHDAGNLQQALYYARQLQLPQRRNLRSRLLSSARSYLFNRLLSMRVEQKNWNEALVGDVLSFTDSNSNFLATAAELSDPRLQQLDLHPTAALWGAGSSAAQGDMAQLEQTLLLDPDAALLANWLVLAELKQQRRIMRLPVAELAWEFVGERSLKLSFQLPTGCFATAVIRELVDVLPENEVESACEF